MKATTLRTLVGVMTPLILTGSVQAGFAGLSTTSKPNEFGLLVVNLYAEFDRPGEDFLIAVAGTANAPMLIQVIGGTFYQHPFGNDAPPPGVLVDTYPSLAYDTFVTIGVKCVGDPPCQPIDAVNFTGTFGLNTLQEAAWAISLDDAQGDPFNPNYVAGDGRAHRAVLDGGRRGHPRHDAAAVH